MHAHKNVMLAAALWQHFVQDCLAVSSDLIAVSAQDAADTRCDDNMVCVSGTKASLELYTQCCIRTYVE